VIVIKAGLTIVSIINRLVVEIASSLLLSAFFRLWLALQHVPVVLVQTLADAIFTHFNLLRRRDWIHTLDRVEECLFYFVSLLFSNSEVCLRLLHTRGHQLALRLLKLNVRVGLHISVGVLPILV